MTLNRDVFLRDPVTWTIPNEGVTIVKQPQTTQDWAVLQHELESFVCDGEYRSGLERILHSYVDSFDRPVQPSAWVSGFYGSGKSHLVRVLSYLWRDIELPGTGGQRARGLANLPDDIRQHLTELSSLGRREGGLWAAAGKLDSGLGPDVRLAILGVAFTAAGLPAEYQPARLSLHWKQTPGLYEAVKAGVESGGVGFDDALANMWVSRPLAASWRAAQPDQAPDVDELRRQIRAQYPPETREISASEFLSALRETIALQAIVPGRLPCTLLVLDELQQFIGDSPHRSLQVQDAIEAISSAFESRLLVVATGQAQLSETPQLQRLQGRFPVRVSLSSADVDRVVREVVLRKKPEHEPELRSVLNDARGEIARQLAGTHIGARTEDERDLAADYPLLPVRRRFWDLVLRAVDASGTAGQLRSQLRTVLDATRDVGDEPLGRVIRADTLFAKLRDSLINGGVLSAETDRTIAAQRDEMDGELRQRICALIFLMHRLSAEVRSEQGLRTDAGSLADLLVDDLSTGGAAMRERLPAVLAVLADRGVLMRVDDDYLLQSPTSQQWDQEYRRLLTVMRGDDGRVASQRSAELQAALRTIQRAIRLRQGSTNEARELSLHNRPDRPTQEKAVVVWVRDGWETTEAIVESDAREAGVEDPTVYVFLPRRGVDALDAALRSWLAADECIRTMPTPHSPDGIEALRGTESRRSAERRKLDALIDGVLSEARTYQGGGTDVPVGNLQAALQTAAEAALGRLYRRFGDADRTGWDRAYRRAYDGNTNALGEVGWSGDAERHPVCEQVRDVAGATGRKGSAIRDHVTAPPFGWPRDAVDAALVTLVLAGQLRAEDGSTVLRHSDLTRPRIGTATFRREGVTLSLEQRLALRGVLQDNGLPHGAGDEMTQIPVLLDRWHRRAADAGGEPPAPPAPDTADLRQLQALAGPQQLVAVCERLSDLRPQVEAWSTAARRIQERLPHWALLQGLFGQAETLPELAAARERAQAIAAQRLLLAEPDPVAPLLGDVSAALRRELEAVRSRLEGSYAAELAALQASADWQQLDAGAQVRILTEQGVLPAPPLAAGDDAALLRSLVSTSLSAWRSMTDALPERAARAREAAARTLQPEAVRLRPPPATLASAPAVEEYIKRLREQLLAEVAAGRPVIIT